MANSSDEQYTSAESDLDFESAKQVSSNPSSDFPGTSEFVVVASAFPGSSKSVGDKKISGVKEGNQYKYDSRDVTFAYCGEKIDMFGDGKDVNFKLFVKSAKNLQPKSGMEFLDSKLVDNLAAQDIHLMRPTQIATLQATFFDNPAAEQETSDFIGISSTGSGKTHAFLVPIVQQCLNRLEKVQNSNKRTPLALIFAHTNTLVQSIYDRAEQLVKRTDVNVQIIAGKHPYLRDTFFDIGVCSVGRFSEHFGRNPSKGLIDVKNVKYVVIDEADKMAESYEFNPLFKELKDKATFSTMLFSATVNPLIMEYIDASSYFEFNFGTPNSVALSIKQVFCQVNSRSVTKITGFATGDKKIEKYESGTHPHPFDALYHFINQKNKQANKKRFMVFVKRTCVADFIAQKLTAYGIIAIAVHGSSSKNSDKQVVEQRKRLLGAFVEGKVHVLVATQLLTRGTDLEVDYVINYDLPVNYSEFVHRCGRTGRNQKTGTAITFVDFENFDDYSPKVLQQIVLNTDQNFPPFLKDFVENTKAAQKLQLQDYKEFC